MRGLVVALVAACGGSPSPATLSSTVPAPSTTARQLSPALEPLAWLEGHWNFVHWHAAGGAMYGISITEEEFNLYVIDDAPLSGGTTDGKLRAFYSHNGTPMVELDGTVTGPTAVAFVAMTDSGQLRHEWSREGDALTGLFSKPDYPMEGYTTHRLPHGFVGAPELESVDRAFSDATRERGIEGWMAAFEPDGSMHRKNRQIGLDSIRDMMEPLLANGTLTWAPLASVIRLDVGVGYTVGTATYTAKTSADSWRSSYVTIWAKQPDGTWKVRFDTGRPITE
jgi:ketosteroid isomerase-like protein